MDPSPLWLEAHTACNGIRDDMWDWLEERHHKLTAALERSERWLRQNPDAAPLGLYGEIQEVLSMTKSKGR